MVVQFLTTRISLRSSSGEATKKQNRKSSFQMILMRCGMSQGITSGSFSPGVLGAWMGFTSDGMQVQLHCATNVPEDQKTYRCISNGGQ